MKEAEKKHQPLMGAQKHSKDRHSTNKNAFHTLTCLGEKKNAVKLYAFPPLLFHCFVTTEGSGFSAFIFDRQVVMSAPTMAEQDFQMPQFLNLNKI